MTLYHVGCDSRYFPNEGTQVTTNIQDIIKLLDNHVKNAYSSFKKAFLEIDKVNLFSDVFHS